MGSRWLNLLASQRECVNVTDRTAAAIMSSELAGFFQGTEMPTAGWWEALWPDPSGVLGSVGLKAGADVIDLCSGDGWFTLQIAKIARHVDAIDIDRNLLEVARHRCNENGVTNCDFVAGASSRRREIACRGPQFVFIAKIFYCVPDRAPRPADLRHHRKAACAL